MRFLKRLKETKEIVTLPSSLGWPCIHCPKNKEHKAIYDPIKAYSARGECMKTCAYIEHFDIYGVNKFMQPSIKETEHILGWMNEVLVKLDMGQELNNEEIDQLRYWRDRLSLLVAMEEAKLDAAYSAMNRVDKI
jgi:hypothetical protein